ncbi:MAG: lysylphosphatidylglycerol synthase transmembrane domain-containing protein [Bythopirellula sp.]|nr:lysylphosphatidylglycerol synthase transmembrane domain-containing protein [Bythopirellula sp.]
MNHHSKSLKIALATGKVLLALGIVGYLVVKIQRDAGFSRLVNEPKEWSYLAIALAMVLTAFTCSFVRWYLLVRGLGLTFHLRDALRLGSLGFMLNQVMPGSVGGDLFKAAFIAHEQPGRRTEAVASVFIDRFVGVVAMFVVASVALSFADQTLTRSSLLSGLKVFIWAIAAGGMLGICLLTSRLISGLRAQRLVTRWPVVGPTLGRLVAGLHQFGSRRRYLVAAFVLALTTHCLLVSAFWCVSRGLPITGPTFQQNATIVPLALVAGALPLTPGGLGLTETALAKLYGAIQLNEADGALVALGYRALTYVVAAIGACYYLSAKRRIDRLLEEAETLAEEIV